MEITIIYQNIISAGQKILEAFPAKALAGAILALLLQKHTMLFLGFILLVAIDCVTRWLAISHDYLAEQGTASPTIVDDIMALKKARSAGLISSAVMKHQGLGKILVYAICAIVAAIGDLMMGAIGVPAWTVSLIVGYMVATEILSIIENLSDAGVSGLDGIIGKIKGRLK